MQIGSEDRMRAEARAFGGQRADLAAHLEALANDGRQVLQDLAEIAAGGPLDGDRGDEQRQVVLADAEIEVAQAGFEIGPVGDLVRDDAELAADRVAHLARHHGDRDRHRMAGAQAAHDHVEAHRGTARRTPSAGACAGSAAPGRAAPGRRTARSAAPAARCRAPPRRPRTPARRRSPRMPAGAPMPTVRPDCSTSWLKLTDFRL